QSVETQVEGARGVGELANGDDVHAGGRELRDRLQADVAAGLGGGTAVDQGDGLRELGGAEVIQHDAVHPGSQDWFDLVHAVDLHLDVGRVTDPAADDAQRLGDRPLPKAGGERRKVVVLHHHGVREPVAVVVATAYAHGVLLEGAQARGGFPGVDDAGIRTCDGVDVAGGQGCDCAHALREVQGDALGGEDTSGRPLDDRELLARSEAGALGGEFGHGDRRIGELESGADDLPAGEDPVLAGGQRGAEAGVGGDGRLGGDVSPGGILGEGSADGDGDGVLGEHGTFRVLLRGYCRWAFSCCAVLAGSCAVLTDRYAV